MTGLASPELAELYRRRGWNLPVWEVVATGFWNDHRLVRPLSEEQRGHILNKMKLLGIADLAQRGFLELSQGQGMKVLLARALVSEPRFLIMDECLTGLDRGSLSLMSLVLEHLAQKGGQIICTTHRHDELFQGITHTLTLDKGRIVNQASFKPRKKTANLSLAPSPARDDFAPKKRQKGFQYHINQGQVAIDHKPILKDINWTVKKDEHWALMGQNGSGKSTLLKLLSGDLHPKKGGVIERFDGKNPKSIWEIRRKTGFVSSDFQARHFKKATVLDTVVSGFFGSVGLHQKPRPTQIEAAKNLLENLKITDWAQKDIANLSYGQLRKVLLARAMVTGPEVLLLDEPLAGLDNQAREMIMQVIQDLADQGVTIIQAVHHPDELISAISHVALLDKGRITWQGSRSDLGV
jgi:molybdate transport system ATP-binding protein